MFLESSILTSNLSKSCIRQYWRNHITELVKSYTVLANSYTSIGDPIPVLTKSYNGIDKFVYWYWHNRITDKKYSAEVFWGARIRLTLWLLQGWGTEIAAHPILTINFAPPHLSAQQKKCLLPHLPRKFYSLLTRILTKIRKNHKDHDLWWFFNEINHDF